MMSRCVKRRWIFAISGICFPSISSALSTAPYGINTPPTGPYAPAAGQTGSTAIAYTDPSFQEWASGYSDLTRGPEDIANPTAGNASYGAASNAIGPADASTSKVVSLGDGGSMTLTFNTPIKNGPGADFAVFENAFNDNFLELAFVDVSSDGTHFTRFPAVSLTPTTTQEGSFADDLQATNLYDLAGKYRAGYGTPFDLAELTGSPNLDINNIKYVRVVDVVGRITPATDGNGNTIYTPTTDAFGNLINDPYPTAFATGGFDLNGVGVINEVPEPTCLGLLLIAGIAMTHRKRARRIRLDSCVDQKNEEAPDVHPGLRW